MYQSSIEKIQELTQIQILHERNVSDDSTAIKLVESFTSKSPIKILESEFELRLKYSK